jgi:hypothetical protein
MHGRWLLLYYLELGSDHLLTIILFWLLDGNRARIVSWMTRVVQIRAGAGPEPPHHILPHDHLMDSEDIMLSYIAEGFGKEHPVKE